MQIGLLTDSLSTMTRADALDTAAALGVETVEIGLGGTHGGWSPAPHADMAELLTDAAARDTLRRDITSRGLRLEAFNAAGNPLHPFRIDLARLPEIELRGRKIVAHDANQFYRRKETRAERRVGGRSAQEIGVFFYRSFDGIEPNGTNNENRHIRNQRSQIRGRRHNVFFAERAYSAASRACSKPETITTRRAPAARTSGRLSSLMPPMQKIGMRTAS